MKAQNFFNPTNQKHLNLLFSLFSIKTRLHPMTVSEFLKKETWGKQSHSRRRYGWQRQKADTFPD